MPQIKISALPTGTPKATDLTPATDPLDTSSAPSGTTKKYIRSDEFNFYASAFGYTTLTSVVAASTVALTATYANGALGVGATLTNAGAMAALTLDGVTLAAGNRVLIWNQASQFQNGIYTVTTVGSGAVNWVLTRATDYDQAAEIAQGQVVLVQQGTLYGGKAFQQTNTGPFTMGTTSIIFALFSSFSSAFHWQVVTTSPISMVRNNGYVTNTAGAISLSLPAVSAVGDELRLINYGAGLLTITQGAGQRIFIGAGNTTLGVGGTVATSAQYDSFGLICVVANTIWVAPSAPQSAGLIFV